MAEGKLVVLDGRRRVSLASFNPVSDLYLIVVDPSGRIVLEPASVVSLV